MRQFQSRRLEIETVENDQIGVGKQFAVRRDRLEGMLIDPFRDDAGELNSVAGDIFHDASDRRDGGDDVEFLVSRSGWFLFLAVTGCKKKHGRENHQQCYDECKFHLVKDISFFVQTGVAKCHESLRAELEFLVGRNLVSLFPYSGYQI